MTEPALDRRIEAWLGQRFCLDVDFEVDDALDKLDRFGLLNRDGDRLSVRPLPSCARRARPPLGRPLPVPRALLPTDHRRRLSPGGWIPVTCADRLAAGSNSEGDSAMTYAA